jgi:hypothetical protein|eukprot:COSAG06_NODE_64346_length_259_cov_7.268750_1_plen_46_part_10
MVSRAAVQFGAATIATVVGVLYCQKQTRVDAAAAATTTKNRDLLS